MSEPTSLGTPFERVVLVSIDTGPAADDLPASADQELARLVHTLGGKVVAVERQRIDRPHPQFYIRPGKVERVAQVCAIENADTVVVDAPLTPTQIASLEEKTHNHVMDRRELILEIFARRARTAEAKMQVELAYLDFVHPRMERAARAHREYRGGMRGSGASIVQKRLQTARRRRATLRRRLEKIQQHQSDRVRSREGLPTVALVGYTNAGKSSLLRALSGQEVYVDDLLFATLDTTTRRVFLPGGTIALTSDTVGFIRNLPHELVACFHSTLQEALAARVLVHVVDATAPDLLGQVRTVDETLEELGAAQRPRVVALNKMDRLDHEDTVDVALQLPDAVPVSAVTGAGLDVLRARIERALQDAACPAEAR